jgi:hypothetical protein
MTSSVLRTIFAPVVLLAALTVWACGAQEDTESPPAGAGGSGDDRSGWFTAMGGGSSGRCVASLNSLPVATASYLDAGPDAAASDANEQGAGTPADGGVRAGGSAADDAGAGLNLPRRVRVAVEHEPFVLIEASGLGPGAVLLQDENPYRGSDVIDLRVSTARPSVFVSISCDESSALARIELVLHPTSIDAVVSKASIFDFDRASLWGNGN